MLTDRQDRFVAEYLVDLNATQAAIRAGYAEATANREGSRLLANAEIRARLDEARQDRSERTNIQADRVLQEIACQAFYDPRDLVEVKKPADIAALPEDIRRAIAGWGYDRNGQFMFKTADKLRALDMLARHLGLYQDHIEVTHNHEGRAERLARARQRKAANAGLIDALPDDVGAAE